MKVTGAQYLDNHADLKAAGVDPLFHFLTYVCPVGPLREGRIIDVPEPVKLPVDWNWQAYLAAYKDLRDAGFTTQAQAEAHYLTNGYKENRWPLPNQPGTEIKSFSRIVALNDPDNCYFTGCRVNGEMQFATYKDGSYQSKIKTINNAEIGSFNCESNFMIIPFNGSYNMSQEHGEYSRVDKGMIWRIINGVWKEVYRHPRWTIITEMYANPVDGFLYASGCKLDTPSDPGGIVRSSDGVNWSVWFENQYWYRFWGMTSRPNGSMVIASTSGGKDWDMSAKDCSPSVFEGGNNLTWRDDSHRGSGFWAAEYWHGDIYLGRCGEAAVVRLSDKKDVLSMPGYEAIHDFAIDKKTDTLLAFCNRGSGGGLGAMVKATKDGDNWHTVVPDLNVPSIIDGIYDDQDETMYLMGGRFAGDGAVFKGVR